MTKCKGCRTSEEVRYRIGWGWYCLYCYCALLERMPPHGGLTGRMWRRRRG